MNEAPKRIWISFIIPIFVKKILEEVAVVNKTNLLTLISDIVYKKTGVEINASDIRIKTDKHNCFLKYISLEIPKNKADELTSKGLERNKSRQKLLLEICEDFTNDVIKYLEKKPITPVQHRSNKPGIVVIGHPAGPELLGEQKTEAPPAGGESATASGYLHRPGQGSAPT